MKTKCDKNKLKEAVVLAEKGVGKNTSLPILSNILIEADEKQIIIKSTNLETGLEVSVPSKVSSVGNISINGSILSSFLQNLSKTEEIEMESVGGNLKIKTKTESVVIRGVNSEDFPIIPKIKSSNHFTVDSGQLVLGLRSVQYAASTSDIKPEIASVYIYNHDGFLVFVATDSFRLAEKKIKIDAKDEINIILPFKSVLEAIRIFDGVDEELRVEADKNQISIYSRTIHFTSRVIDGVFPDYRQIIPKDFKTEVTVLKSELSEKLKMAVVFSDKFSQVDFKIFPKLRKFEIVSESQDIGESDIETEAVLEGEDLEAGFNARYILESLGSFSSDSVSLGFNEKNKPLLLRGVGDETFRYLVMPLYR